MVLYSKKPVLLNQFILYLQRSTSRNKISNTTIYSYTQTRKTLKIRRKCVRASNGTKNQTSSGPVWKEQKMPPLQKKTKKNTSTARQISRLGKHVKEWGERKMGAISTLEYLGILPGPFPGPPRVQTRSRETGIHILTAQCIPQLTYLGWKTTASGTIHSCTSSYLRSMEQGSQCTREKNRHCFLRKKKKLSPLASAGTKALSVWYPSLRSFEVTSDTKVAY